jgi:4-amino-4-deoxy-L-arabinose transferase-like glycosyltransferase
MCVLIFKSYLFDSEQKSEKLILIGLCLFGFVLRVLYTLFYNPGIIWPDETRYWNEALNIAQHWIFSQGNTYANDMPLTALIMGIFQMTTHTGVLGVKLLIAFMSACTIYWIGKMAQSIYPSKISLWIAGALAAIYPFFIYYSSLILSETFFLFFTCLFFRNLLEESTRKTILSGTAAGLAHLTRPTLLYFLPMVLIWKYFFMKYPLKRILLFLVIFCVLISPWVIRNYFIFDEILISSTTAGHVLWEGNNPWNKTGGVAEAQWGYLKDMPASLTEIQQDKWKKEQAVSYIRSHPKHFFELSVKRFFRFWHLWPNAEGFDRGWYKWIAFFSFGPVFLISLCSLWILRRNWRKTIILWLFIFYMTGIHMITIGSLRYRLPLEPLLIVLASASLGVLYDQWLAKKGFFFLKMRRFAQS